MMPDRELQSLDGVITELRAPVPVRAEWRAGLLRGVAMLPPPGTMSTGVPVERRWRVRPVAAVAAGPPLAGGGGGLTPPPLRPPPRAAARDDLRSPKATLPPAGGPGAPPGGVFRGRPRRAPGGATRGRGDPPGPALLRAEPLYAKAAEGVLKGAEDARIVNAVRTLARELGAARAALGAVDDADLIAAASALHVGASMAMVEQLRDTQLASPTKGRSSLATAFVALADLLTRRVPPLAAAAAIDSLVARRAPSEDFAALRAAVERDIDAGRSPEAAVLQRTQVLLRGIDARRP